MAKLGKRMTAARQGIDRQTIYPLDEAVKMIKQCGTAKFDETVEIAIGLGVDPRHSDQMVRGVVALPHGTGKTMRVAVFAKGDKAAEAEAAGADLVGAEDLAERIQGGEIDFDRCIATPDMMAVVGRLGKVLGPRGLMPNPKLGTVTQDIADAVAAAKGGEIQFRVETGEPGVAVISVLSATWDSGAGGSVVRGGSPRSRRAMSAMIRGSFKAPRCANDRGGVGTHHAVRPGGAAFSAPTTQSPSRA